MARAPRIKYLLIVLPKCDTLVEMEPSPKAIELLMSPTGGLLRAALAPSERLTHAVPAIGCTIALTTRRLFVIRDGSAFRPKTGIRDWPLEGSLDVKPGLIRHGSGSLVIRHGRDVTSVFVPTEQWSAAIQLIGAVRSRARRGQTDGTAGSD
jgi:hypothetical protein